ncbi:MAG: NCS2 family permease [Oscillospiraceae bacterium]|nr:NCS2 family permease [Oscillospiraceae bacterium]
MDKFFKLKENNTNVKTEILAGVTTFITMAYIIFVNPYLLTITAGEHLFTSITIATCIAAAIGTLIMGLYAKIPFAQAPGMGLNAFFAFTIIPMLGGYGGALAAVFISGVLFIIITLLGLRQAIVKAIPNNIKFAITAGIGLFIAFIGMQNAGLIVSNDATIVSLVDFSKFGESMSGEFAAEATAARGALIAIVGVLLIGVLMKLKIKGAILIGIIASTVMAFPLGLASMPDFSAGWNLELSPSLFKMDFSKIFLDESGAFNISALFTAVAIIISCFMIDMFDTIGTLLGTAGRANMLDEKGEFPQMKKAMMADAVATTAGACLGTSTVTTYIESGAGISEGGRTGLTAVTAGILFILAIFIAPLALMVPGAATAPALIMVGVLMMGSIAKIDFEEMTEAVPAFLTIALMPLTYSIATGIGAGLVAYPVLKLCTGKAKEVHWIAWILAILFILKFTVLPS